MFAKRNKKKVKETKKKKVVLYAYMSWLQVINDVVSSLTNI